ncbi:MAG: nucleotidyltransferase family protein [Bacteroidetes bacterium]|jgi:dTDP-glucose pyrophosphorylase|nr:nucleotidyltransferase family protein [Bacteroidota bacterium]
MIDFNKYIVSEKETARSILQLINELAIPNMAVFIVNDKKQLVGSLTDGDIRRGLLNGRTIDESITFFMNTKSKCFVEGENNFEKVANYKAAGIRFIPIVNKDSVIIKIIDLDKLKSIIPVNAILMAGGKGERLKPLTDTTPKPMLKIGDKPIIVRNIERLASFGVNEFTISVRHLAEQIIDGVNAAKVDDVKIDFVKEESPLGTIGAVKLMKGLSKDVILLMNSDLLTNIDFQDFYKKFLDSKADMQVATIPYNVDIPYAVMEINNKDEVTAFSEKPRYTYYSNAGVYLFKKELISLIPDNTPFDATHFMEAVIKSQKKLISYPILSYWLDIGRIEDYYKAQEDVKHINF